MSTRALLAEVMQRGITRRRRGGDLVVRTRAAVDEDLLARVREAKPVLVRLLRAANEKSAGHGVLSYPWPATGWSASVRVWAGEGGQLCSGPLLGPNGEEIEVG